jgi:histidinol-phosphate/aromatic aminotransferase/cobyric acid decarboxylase-like protein
MAAQKGIHRPRVAVWPTYVRVSVGTREEMSRFKDAWMKVMSA